VGGAAVAAGTAGAGSRVVSNILRGDYAGSDSCARCHAEIHAAWRNSPMHLMTRVPTGAAVHAPFEAGATLRFKEDTARLVERDGAGRVAPQCAPPATANAAQIARPGHRDTSGDYRGCRVTKCIAAFRSEP